MAQVHFLHGLCDAFRLLPIQADRASCFDGTEATTARADAPEDHEGSGFVTPAFSNIGATCLLTYRVQLFTAHQLLEIFVVFTFGWAHSQPFWAALRNDGGHQGFL